MESILYTEKWAIFRSLLPSDQSLAIPLTKQEQAALNWIHIYTLVNNILHIGQDIGSKCIGSSQCSTELAIQIWWSMVNNVYKSMELAQVR